MNALIAVAFSVAASAQTIARPPVGGTAFAAAHISEYVRRAAQGGQGTAQVQFAILHALMGWQGGTNPPYSFYESQDRVLLASLGITVKPLEDRARRAIVETRLAEIRGMRNFGGAKVAPTVEARREAAMIAQHQALIAGYAGHITFGPPQDVGHAARQDALARSLIRPIQDMAAAGTDAAFARALASFNAAAAKFGKGYAVKREPGAPRTDALDAALKIYGAARAEALRMARGGRTIDAPPSAGELEKLWRKEGSRFDGQDPGRPGATSGASMGETLSQTSYNPPEERPSLSVSVSAPREDRAVTKRGGSGSGRKPGLFGLLGELFKAIGRTISRVAKALLS